MFRLDIYITKKGNPVRVKNVKKDIPTWAEAERLCIQKNKDLGVPKDLGVSPGQRYAMFDSQ
jgi:hypothetical protein